MNNIEDYGINDIETLPFAKAIRKRISMYLGSNDMQGVYNGIQEIISNSVDEFYMGFGNKIEITVDESSNRVSVKDYGRGIPFGIKEDGSNVLVDIFSKPHTGGKFNEKSYNSVAGLNGIGAKATCLSSTEFYVKVVRNGEWATALFKDGVLIEYKNGETKEKQSSTYISFIPSAEVFPLEPIQIKFDVLCEKCRNLSYLTKGLKFELRCGDKTEVYCAKNGIADFINDMEHEKINSKPLVCELKEDGKLVEVVLQWTKDHSNEIYTFTNGLENPEGGTPVTGLKTAVTRFARKYIDDEIGADMARTGLVCAISCKIPNPSYANQTKTKINNPELNGFTQRATTEALEHLIDDKENFKAVKDFLLREKRAEIAATKARQAVMESQKAVAKEMRKKSVLAGKLIDCESHGEDSQLLLVEGKSALGAIVKSRDSKHTACYPLRGIC